MRHLFVSPGHNYFGRQGQAAGEHPLLEQEQIECVAGRGIRGDRFFDFKENYKGQITFFAWEVLTDLWEKFEVTDRNPAATRRNVITEGVDLNGLIGQRFVIQSVEFEGVEECRPCAWMNQAIKEGAEHSMKGRGGLRARIVTGGTLKCDIAR